MPVKEGEKCSVTLDDKLFAVDVCCEPLKIRLQTDVGVTEVEEVGCMMKGRSFVFDIRSNMQLGR